MINEPWEYGADGPDKLACTWLDPDQRRRAFKDLAAWSRAYAPRAVTAEELLAAMPGSGASNPSDDIFFAERAGLWSQDEGSWSWTFAEDGLRLIYHRLGFPPLDEVVFSHPRRDE